MNGFHYAYTSYDRDRYSGPPVKHPRGNRRCDKQQNKKHRPAEISFKLLVGFFVFLHGSVAMIVVHFAFCTVHRNIVVVDAETVSLRITVGKKSSLQESVR